MDNILVSERFKYISIHFVVCVLCLIYVEGMHMQMNFRLMNVFTIWSLLIFVRLILLEIKHTSGLTLVLFYLIGCFFRVGTGGYYLSIKGMDHIGIYYMSNYVSDYIFPTAIWMNITYMLFLGTFTYFTKGINTNIDFSGYVKKYNTFAFAILLYIVAYIFYFFQIFRIADSINSLISELNFVAILLIMFTCVYKHNRIYFAVFFILISIEILIAVFGGFYKTKIIMPLLFVLMYYYLKNKQLKKRILSFNLVAAISVMFIFLLLFVYPFMNEKRERSGFDPVKGTATKDYSNLDIIEDIVSGKIKYEESNEPSDQFISRVDAIVTNAFFYKNAYRFNKYMADIIEISLLTFVPKVLYPNKPPNNAGLMSTALADHGTTRTTYETTYTFIGFFSSMYMIGGVFAVIVLCFLNGFIYARIYRIIIQHIFNPFSLLLLLRLIIEAYTAYEETTTAGIASWVAYSVYLVFIFATNLLFTMNKRTKYISK